MSLTVVDVTIESVQVSILYLSSCLWSLGERRKLILTLNDSTNHLGLFFYNLTLCKRFFLAHLSNLVHIQGSPTDLLELIFQSSRRIRGMSSDHFHFQMEVWCRRRGVTLNARLWMPSLGVHPYYSCSLRWTVRAGFFSPNGGVYRADAFIQASVLDSRYNQHWEVGWKKWLFHYSQH